MRAAGTERTENHMCSSTQPQSPKRRSRRKASMKSDMLFVIFVMGVGFLIGFITGAQVAMNQIPQLCSAKPEMCEEPQIEN